MSRNFAITTVNSQIELKKGKTGSVSYTVTNSTDGQITARAKVTSLDDPDSAWFGIEGNVERVFAENDTQQYSVKITLPPSVKKGSYKFKLNVFSVENPDEIFSEGPVIEIVVNDDEKKPDGAKFPWWVVAVILGVLIIAGGIIWYIASKDKPEPPQPEPQKNPEIVSFEASKYKIKKGETVTLSWEVTNASEITLSPDLGDIPLKGTRTIAPAKTSNYSITAKNDINTLNKIITVIVEEESPEVQKNIVVKSLNPGLKPKSIPSDLKLTCLTNGTNLISAMKYPVFEYNGIRYWPFSYINNSVNTAIVGYDQNGNVVKRINKPGMRYYYKIVKDKNINAVTIWGQGDKTVTVTEAELSRQFPHKIPNRDNMIVEPIDKKIQQNVIPSMPSDLKLQK